MQQHKRAQEVVAIVLWLLSLSLVIWGCATNRPYVIHSGSIPLAGDAGLFDSHTADFLSEERAYLDSFKGKTEPRVVQESLGYAEKQYAITKASYLTWRTVQTAVALQDLNAQKAILMGATGNVAAAQKASGQ